jgi:methionyl-tRNA formyltransferase
VNVHASVLPRWRGAAPIQRAILAGDACTGVSIMRMEAGLDTGPVYLVRETEIAPDETAGQLHDRLAALGAEALAAALPGIADGTLQPQPQDDARATYAQRIEKVEAQIDWTRPAVEIWRRVRAFNPVPVCETRFGKERLRIWEARVLDAVGSAAPGSVLAGGRDGIDVATGSGVLRLLRVQRAGGRPVSAAEYARGHALDGVRFT